MNYLDTMTSLLVMRAMMLVVALVIGGSIAYALHRIARVMEAAEDRERHILTQSTKQQKDE